MWHLQPCCPCRANSPFPLHSFPGRPCDDLCGLWLPHDLPQALWIRSCGFQFPPCCLWDPVGSPDARLVPLFQEREDSHWSGEVRRSWARGWHLLPGQWKSWNESQAAGNPCPSLMSNINQSLNCCFPSTYVHSISTC